jgi:hypothetical protein
MVTPTADVTTRVIIRASATSQSAQVGSLNAGHQLELVGSVPYWYEVQVACAGKTFSSQKEMLADACRKPTPKPK